MQNPFVYGEVVSAATFVNRVVELDRLVGDLSVRPEDFPDLAAALRQVVADPPGAGLARAARHADRGGHGQQLQLLRGLPRGLRASADGGGNQVGSRADLAREAIRSARAEVRYVPDPTLATPGSGSLSVSFPSVRSDREVSRLAQEVFALPARLAAARQRPVVVALDEFQAIGGFNGGSVEHALRAAVQHQREVGYVFAGSEPSLMERMLTPKRPFYKAGPVMRLEKIPADEFAGFIEARFTRSGIRPEPGLGLAIVDLAGNLPYDVQRLAHETWDEVRVGARKRATLDDLHQALKRLLVEQATMFEALWQRLTLPQRAVLRSVVLEDGRELMSADIRTRHRLGGASTVQAALGALRRDDVISREGDRYVVVDSLLREWVARRTF